MVEIPEYKRDESKDYLAVLRSLNEIPFPVGRNLLAEFLHGDETNSSIEKNKMYEMHNFGALNFLGIEKIFEMIEDMIRKELIDLSPSIFNKNIKVLSISKEGTEELIHPGGIDEKKQEEYPEEEPIEIEGLKELDEFLSGFNMDQKRAVVSSKEKILCIAGAGSGKTSVLIKRIEFLRKMKRVKEEKILAITFTRKAREEMEKRLKVLGVGAIVETFNSFSEKVLLRRGVLIYGRKFRTANFQDKMVAVLRSLDNMNMNLKEAVELYFEGKKQNKEFYKLQSSFVSDVFSLFDYYKLSKLSVSGFRKKYLPEGEISNMLFELIQNLEKYFFSLGLRTYADQVKDTVSFFKSRPKFIPEFEHILVDEFQDVNSEQVELLEILNPKNLFCVGDPRQSIFGWRGSEINYIMKFKENNPNSEIIYLKDNYRSNGEIVDIMNESIRKMGLPDLRTNKKGESETDLMSFDSENEEFEFVKEKILNSEVERGEVFVLARTNRILNGLSRVLKKAGIKFILRNDESLAEAKKGEVTLSTIHSIKGLEAKLVFVIGCTPSNFPSRYSEHPVLEKVNMYDYDKEEEERRLFYVAISRAKEKLYLTYSGKRHTYFINDEMKELMG